MTRPDFIKHYKELEEPETPPYPGSPELFSIGAPLGKALGLTRHGIHHETIPPGRRTSWPHAESTEEEFFFVIEGNPDVWLNGRLHRLNPGDAVAFVPGTGLAHTVINNTDKNVRLLVVGDRNRGDNKVHYPLHPKRNEQIGDSHWKDCPRQDAGPHDGLPDASR